MQILPSHKIYVERFLREQRQRKRVLRDRIDEIYADDWKGKPRPGGAGLVKFATDYEEAIVGAGAFGIERSGPIDHLKLKTTKPYEVTGYLLSPIAMGQTVDDGPSHAQEFAMLTRVGATIAANKVVAHQAPLCLAFSKHALERMCERGGAGADVSSVLSRSALALARQLALLLLSRIVKFAGDRPDDPSVSAFLPFAEGILIFSSQYVVGVGHDENLGWKCNFSKRRYSPGYLKRDLVLSDSDIDQRVANRIVVRAWYAATFIGPDQLSSTQRSYVHAVSQLIESASDGTLEQAFDIQFNPDVLFRPDRYLNMGGEVADRDIEACAAALRSSAFQVPDRVPFGLLLEDGTSTRDFRSMVDSEAP